MPEIKTCTKCGAKKPLPEFGLNKKNADGHRLWCKSCCSDAEKERRDRDPERHREADRLRRARNLERAKEKERRADAKRRAKPGFHKRQRDAETARLMELHRQRAEVFQCPVCRVEFCPVFGRLRRKTCSPECSAVLASANRRRKNAARRARLKHASVIAGFDPIEVFSRDGWKCHLCGRRTLQSKRGTTHPRAPELDHIVPLAKGGSHSRANTACACRQCNAAKSDVPYGQPSLLAFLEPDGPLFKPGQPPPMRPCDCCGAVYEARRFVRFCSRQCRLTFHARMRTVRGRAFLTLLRNRIASSNPAVCGPGDAARIGTDR
jgi:5-methylcytosine-specific restriction endonuclease McrA